MNDEICGATRTAAYLRVSTEEQSREGYSIAAQRDRLLAFCRAQGWDVAGIYVDDGYSGASLDRPQLKKLREDVRAGKVNLVLVWKVDRLSRRVSHLAQLVEEFDEHGCAFRSATEPFDTSHAAGRAFLQMLAVFAELERETIRERARHGIHQRIKEGHLHGRPRALGYQVPGAGQVWQVEEREAQVVRWIYDQYLRGVGSMRIAHALKEGVPELPADVLRKEFSHLSIHSLADRVRWILHNPIYAGYTTLNGDLLPGRHEAIIDPDAWHRVQDIFARRRSFGPRSKTSPYILSGLVYCGACGSPMWGFSQGAYPRGRRRPKTTTRTRDTRYAYYVCKQSGLHEGRLKKCSNWGIRKERVEGEVLARIRQLALAPHEVAAALPPEAEPEDEDQRRLRQLRAELAAVRRRQQNLIATIERAPDLEDALLDRLRELADEQRRLQQEIDRLDAGAQNRRHTLSREDLASLLAHVSEVIDNANPDELRELVRLFVRRVIVMPSKEIQVELYPI